MLYIFVLFIYCVHGTVVNPITPLQDRREYLFVNLQNNLQALLIQDPSTEKAALSLNVAAGFYQDPPETPGLAHLCEHMLFQGSEKYPDKSELQLFLNANGGSYNAHTSEIETNYYYDITPSGLYNSMDRFAQAVVKPLFLETSTMNEINAVNSEHEKNIQSDARRSMQLLRHVSNQNHPFSHFGTGTAQTLSKSNIRDEILLHFKKHYCGNKMKLVVLGTEPIETLKEWVVEMFSGVPQCSYVSPSSTDIPFTVNELQKKYFVVPVKELYQLHLFFPIYNISHSLHYKSKSVDFIGNFIGHEGPGSLLSTLKNQGLTKPSSIDNSYKGWVNRLSSSVHPQKDHSFLAIYMDLNPTAMNHTDTIVQIVFDYIRILQSSTELKEKFAEVIMEKINTYDQLQSISWLSFNYSTKEKPFSFVSRVSSAMQTYNETDILIGDNVFMEYDQQMVQNVLNQLLPENMIITEVSKEFSNLTKKEPWYEISYDVEALNLNIYKIPSILSNELTLPRPNPFIPHNFDVGPETSTTEPELLLNNSIEFWHVYDTSFRLPEANWNVLVKTPYVYSSAKSFMMTSVVINCFVDDINEELYDALLVGLGYSVLATPNGIHVQVAGFHDNTPKLLKYILNKLIHYTMSANLFNRIQKKMIRDLSNKQKDSPYNLAEKASYVLLTEPSWTIEEYLAELKDVTYEMTLNHSQLYLSSIRLQALCHGNIPKEDALPLFSDIFESILSIPQPIVPIQAIKAKYLENSIQHYSKHSKNPVDTTFAVKLHLQLGESQIRNTAIGKFCGHLLAEKFMQELRTQQQLGYIVYSSFERVLTMDGLRFVIQSAKEPQYIETQIESFLDNYYEFLTNMSDLDYETHKTSFIQLLSEKPINLADKTRRLWFEIENNRYEWEIMSKQAESLRNTTRADTLAFYQQFISKTGKSRRKLVVSILPQNFDDNIDSINTSEVIL